MHRFADPSLMQIGWDGRHHHNVVTECWPVRLCDETLRSDQARYCISVELTAYWLRLALPLAIAPVGLVTLLIGLPAAIWEKRPIAGLEETS